MRLDTRALAKATGAVAAIAYVLCALLVAVAPGALTQAASYVAHIDLSGLSRSITWSGFVVGLVVWTAATMLAAASTSALYNRWART